MLSYITIKDQSDKVSESGSKSGENNADAFNPLQVTAAQVGQF